MTRVPWRRWVSTRARPDRLCLVAPFLKCHPPRYRNVTTPGLARAPRFRAFSGIVTYEEIIAALRALTAADFHRNPAAGITKFHDIDAALEEVPSPERAIPEIFAVMERLPEADFGIPGPLVFALERMDYTDALVASLRRRATGHAVGMVHRILNSELPPERRRFYVGLLAAVVANPNPHEGARGRAAYVLEQHHGNDP